MARTNRTGLTPAVIDALRQKGMNQTEIADMYGTTRQYVSWIKKNYSGVTLTPREEAMTHYPWKPGSQFHDSQFDRRTRDHLEYMATGGKGMSQDKLKRLASFYRQLKDEDLVVEFHPEIPSYEGNLHGGFALRPRLPSDGDLIIRVNEHTVLTDEGRLLWRFPPQFPDV